MNRLKNTKTQYDTKKTTIETKIAHIDFGRDTCHPQYLEQPANKNMEVAEDFYFHEPLDTTMPAVKKVVGGGRTLRTHH